MSPMETIGTLPDGRTLYYADEHFTEPGFYVPNPEAEGGHQRLELIPARGTPAGEAKPTHDKSTMEGAFLAENSFAAEAHRLLDRAIEKRSEHVLLRAETYATLAVAFEQRQTRFDVETAIANHAQQTGSV